jgi:ATP/maltotriose-dependent transcriptional regulator MalT
MRENFAMPGDIKTLSGVSNSRTHIPTVPPGYLNRKHLFPLMDNAASGTTLVIAPAGYGKSSFVAQWAQGKKVIWMTIADGDSLHEMSTMMIQATRNVIPDFGLWFEKEQPMRPTEVVRRWGNELLETGENYVFVIDILRTENAPEVEIAVRLIEQFPSNIHFVAIRRSPIESIYPVCASRGPLKVLSAQDLRFSDDEVISLVQTRDQNLKKESLDLLLSANGWPAATSLMLENIINKKNEVDLSKLMGSEIEPLRSLALFVVNELKADIVKTAETLSVLEVFDLDVAHFLLGDDFSVDLISSIAIQGEIFSYADGDNQSYVFSQLMREVFLERLRKNPIGLVSIHTKLIEYYESRGSITLAIEHAFQSGNAEKIAELFPTAARMKQAQGLGGDLIRWSAYASMSPDDGYLKGLTVKIVGLLANLDFSAAKVEIERLEIGAKKSVAKEFYLQYVSGARAYINLSVGNFLEVEANVARAMPLDVPCYLGVDDQMNLLRALAMRYYIFDETAEVEIIATKARDLASQTTLDTSHAFLLSIEAMALHQRGEYRRAHEVSSMALAECKRNKFVGIHGPLDAMYIKARCLLEFSKHEEAITLLEELRHLAYTWKQWHWYFAADNHVIQELCINNRHVEALDRIRSSRELVNAFDFSNNLSEIIDLNEMFIRRSLKDFDRLEKLIKRAPNVRHAQLMKMQLDENRQSKSLAIDVKNLPERTPREQIWKHICEADHNIDSERVALPAMQKALKVAANVGAIETFLRQSNELGNLIMKIANDNPTVYNEELASAMAKRIRDRESQMNEGRPALTKRELEILRQLSTGRTLTVIATELHISQNTMKTHLKNLYQKMEVDGRISAVEKAASLFLL